MTGERLKGAAAVAAAGMLAGTVLAQAAAPPAGGDREAPRFDGYDFGQVVEAMETSVNPLQREMNQSFRVFVEGMGEADRLLDEGKTAEAVQKAGAAIEGVLAVREKVLAPMWQGQEALVQQVAAVRARLASAVQAAAKNGPVRLDAQTEATLDAVAARIAGEQDPLRKKRLVAHYRTVRNLARIRAMAMQLSPDQRKMWLSVLQVLDEASVAHQQVMMGTEVLFAQFESTAANLQAYLSLMETVDGASQLMRLVRGVDQHSAGMSSFADSMNELQQRLAGFHESVEQVLQGSMIELEAQIDALPAESQGGLPVMPGEEDAELAARMARLSGNRQ
jgi:flagellar hook-basal body complex protein FliE